MDMCCCEHPTVNGETGYRWEPKAVAGVYPVNPPALGDDDRLLYDEPGRCGGQDSHSHHYRVLTNGKVLVRHGGGEERFRLSNWPAVLTVLGRISSRERYWLLNALYHAHNDGARAAGQAEAARWRQAAAEKRIKTRKQRNTSGVKVWIVPSTGETFAVEHA